jgi:hypothetical protein
MEIIGHWRSGKQGEAGSLNRIWPIHVGMTKDDRYDLHWHLFLNVIVLQQRLLVSITNRQI